MAVCKRCGTVFDYAKREGVCPKCCFYNRPARAWKEDDSWIKNYNYEDNSYEIINREVEYDEKHSGDRLRDVLLHRDLDGSHTHLDNGRVVKGDRDLEGSHTHLDNGRVIRGNGNRPARVPQGKMSSAGRKTGAGPKGIFIAIIWIYIIAMLFMSFLSHR